MLRILAAGELNQDSEGERALEEFAGSLGKAIIYKHHVVLNLCQGPFDRALAKSANQALEESGEAASARRRIVGYYPSDKARVHDFGTVLPSEVDW